MAKTTLKSLGSSVCVDDQDEKMIPALGNGTAIPGDLCYIIPTAGATLGRVGPANVGATEFFSGILMESKITGTETAPAADVPCKLVVPKSGHGYRIRINVAGDTDEIGTGVTFSGTNYKGETTDVTLALSKIGRLSLEVLAGDSVAEINWIE